MHVIRFADRDEIVRVGLTDPDSPAVIALGGPAGPAGIAGLLAPAGAEPGRFVSCAAARAATHSGRDRALPAAGRSVPSGTTGQKPEPAGDDPVLAAGTSGRPTHSA